MPSSLTSMLFLIKLIILLYKMQATIIGTKRQWKFWIEKLETFYNGNIMHTASLFLSFSPSTSFSLCACVCAQCDCAWLTVCVSVQLWLCDRLYVTDCVWLFLSVCLSVFEGKKQKRKKRKAKGRQKRGKLKEIAIAVSSSTKRFGSDFERQQIRERSLEYIFRHNTHIYIFCIYKERDKKARNWLPSKVDWKWNIDLFFIAGLR